MALNKNKSFYKISIITPSFNQGQFLEETIKSVLSQKGNFFIDYIIADGESTDDSVKIIKKYDTLLKTKKFNIKCKGIRYRWWSCKDEGQSSAINRGIDLAEGEIISWLNSDDVYFSTESIFNVVEFFKRCNNVDVFFGDLAYINKKGEILGFYSFQKFNYQKLLYYNYNLGQPSVFFRSNVLKQNKLNENLHYAMDYELWIRLGKKYNFKHIPETLAGFRLYSESKSGSNHSNDLFLEEKKILSISNDMKKKFRIKIFNKIFNGGVSRLKGFIYFIKYRFFLKKNLAFKGKYLKLFHYIKYQFFSRIKS